MIRRSRRSNRVLPREAGAAPLDIVIAIMAFLAALTLGAVLVANRTADGWRAGLAGKLTVQVLPPEQGRAGPRLAAETDAVLAILAATPGLTGAAALSDEQTQALVEPWLGKGALVADLPLPRLIDVTVLPGADADLAALKVKLKAAAPDASLDDHRHWLSRLAGVADRVLWSAYGILLLIAAATAATAAFATRAGLEAHHGIVELLHQMGAHSGFIAGAFDRHYFVTTLAASAAGTGLAAALFVLAGSLEYAGVEPAPFLPPLALSLEQIAWLSIIPLTAGLIAWATARLSVMAALRRIY